MIEPTRNDYDGFGTQGTTTIAAQFRINIRLILQTRTDAVALISRFLRDVHRAVLVDRQRGGNAISTRAVSDTVAFPTDDDEALTQASLLIEVDYRTPWNNLNTPT